MQEDAAVARGLRAGSMGLLAPLELDDEVVILVLLLGDEAAKNLSRDSDRPVLYAKDVFGVLVLAELRQVGVEARQVLAVEELDRFGYGAGGNRCGQAKQPEDNCDALRHGCSPS